MADMTVEELKNEVEKWKNHSRRWERRAQEPMERFNALFDRLSQRRQEAVEDLVEAQAQARGLAERNELLAEELEQAKSLLFSQTDYLNDIRRVVREELAKGTK